MDHTLLRRIKAQISKIICTILLTFALTSCTVSDTVVYEEVDGEVVALFEVCDKLDTQLELYKAYINNKQEGTAEYYARLFEEKCILFPFPVLAKLVKLEFKGPFYDNSVIEIWKVIFDADPPEGEKIQYFWTAIRKQTQSDKKNMDEIKV